MLIDIKKPSRAALPTYDVVIPCFNRADTIERAVASVIAQARQPERIILVDDGSNDDTLFVLDRLERRYNGVETLRLPRNVGASAARNAGLALSRADWIAFLDSDDEWIDDAAAAMLSATSEHDVVVGHFRRAWKSGIIDAPECGWNGIDICAALATAGVIGPSWSIIRQTVATAVGGFDPSFRNCNDWDFYVRVAAAGARFVRIDETVAHYHVAAANRLSLDLLAGEANADRVRALAELLPHREPAPNATEAPVAVSRLENFAGQTSEFTVIPVEDRI